MGHAAAETLVVLTGNGHVPGQHQPQILTCQECPLLYPEVGLWGGGFIVSRV